MLRPLRVLCCIAFGAANADRTMWSGFAAVSVAYSVAIAYCVSAYYEDDSRMPGPKQQ